PERFQRGGAVELLEVTGDVVPRRGLAEAGRDEPAVELVRLGIEPANDPEIDDADPSALEHEEIARVHVAVKGPVTEGGEKPAPHHLVDERTGVDAEACEMLEIVDRPALEIFHHEDSRSRQRRKGARDDQAPEVGVGEVPTEVVEGAALVAEVELLGDLLAETREKTQQLS